MSSSSNDMLENEFEAQLEALAQLEGIKKEKDELLVYKQSNSIPNITTIRKTNDANKSNLKSDLKKTTAFVKKIKSINFEGLQQCIRDTETLNLTLYISEIVTAITETNYKPTDVPSVVKLCVCLHRRYEEFTTGLLSGIKTMLLSSSTSTSSEEEKEFGKKKRIVIRFAIELYQSGIWPDTNCDFFVELLRSLLGKSKQM